MNKVYTLAAIPVISTNAGELASRILRRAGASQKSILFFANTNFILKCQSILPLLRNENVMVVNDGVGVDIGCWLIHRAKFEANLNGTDFTPFLFRQSQKKHRVFLVGSTDVILGKASKYLTENLGQEVAGCCDGFSGLRKETLIADINASRADVVLVAMGNALQEKWILDNYRQLNASVYLGVGALFEFWAGGKPRAPTVLRKMRLEWLFRFFLEPRRLMRRYTIDIFRFFYLCMAKR